jgi:hypothetical protein
MVYQNWDVVQKIIRVMFQIWANMSREVVAHRLDAWLLLRRTMPDNEARVMRTITRRR